MSIYGGLDLTRDKQGLQRARDLREPLVKIVQALEAERTLPDKVALPEPPETVKNPFA